MENEIIIDGVNVAECEFYYYSIQTHCNYCKSSQYSSYCNDYPDCHFKQIKRLKQAKEELQNLWANATAERIKLEAENEKLKEKITKLKNEEWDNYYFASCVKSNFEGVRGATEQLLKCKTLKGAMYYAQIADSYLYFNEDVIKREIKEKQNKYRKALEDIKNVLEENCSQCFEIDNFTKPDDCGICEWARILRIINKVLD